jgi:flagellar M-ring protein FliF
MLEDIVGHGRAIVRVSAAMDFSQVNVNEEIFDPDAQVVRSKQSSTDQSNRNNDGAANISSVNPVARGVNAASGIQENKQHQDETINYEISKVVRSTINPVGKVTRLSVAAVIDGTYVEEVNANGERGKKFVPRTQEDINRFTTIVKQAMGYSADREDEISVESMALATSDGWAFEEKKVNWDTIKKEYGKAIANIVLIILVFIFIVRPLIKTVRAASETEDETKLLGGDEEEYLLDDKGQLILPKPKVTTIQEKATGLAKENVSKTANILKGWLSEK